MAPAVMVAMEDARGLVEIAGPGIVAEALPEPQNLLLLRLRQAGEVGKGGKPARKVGKYPFHLRLLEHDLRKPDVVGLIFPPPGQVASVLGKPGEQRILERGGLRHDQVTLR